MNRIDEEHIVSKIQSSTLISSPFNYFYAENFFSSSLFDQLKSLTPSRDSFIDATESKDTHAGTSMRGRYLLPYFEENISSAGADKQLIDFFFWVKYFLMQRVAVKLGVQYKNTDTWLHCAFTSDIMGYMKLPHTDHPRKLFTLMVYMSDCDIGTTILTPKDSSMTDPIGNDHEYKKFNEGYTAPFRANAALALIRTDNSFHCVKPVTSRLPRHAFHAHIWKK